MKDKLTTSEYVHFPHIPLTLEAVFTRFGMPRRLQKKRILIHQFDGLTKGEVRERLKMTFLQEGELRLDRCVWYQVYGNLRGLYVCLFAEDHRCIETYFFKGWVKYVFVGRLASCASKIKRHILFGTGKFLLWILGKGGEPVDVCRKAE